MKIYAVPKNQPNTCAPNYWQNNSISTSYIGKTNLSKDKFVSSNLNFGKNQLQENVFDAIAVLFEKLNKGEITAARCREMVIDLIRREAGDTGYQNPFVDLLLTNKPKKDWINVGDEPSSGETFWEKNRRDVND